MTEASASSVKTTTVDGIDVLRGPDLNSSRTPLDKKTYRQILLPNGLRAVLVSDTIAMHQHDGYYDDEDDESFSADSSNEKDQTKENDNDDDHRPEGDNDDDDDDDDDDEFEEDDDGLRDAAVAVLVGVGSMYDPPEAQGLAHFLEHMLFMGTEKYPKENAFDEFISKSGGSDNAYTELEYTVYHLEIPQEGLFKALDMMAQFFISPMMLEDAVERELNSIESEFQLSKNCDESRLLQLLCHTSGNDPKCHPFSKFSWGNLKSLKEIPEKNKVDVMKELWKFYHQYYVAPNMRLVVVGGYTLDILEERVVNCFSDVPSKPKETSPHYPRISDHGSWSGNYVSAMKDHGLPLQPLSLGKIYRIIPVKEFHCLSITWQLPSQFANWRSKPCDYVSHLLGHESEGSLLSSLKSKSWATGLYAGAGSQGLEDASSHTLFTLNITLSEEGVSRWSEILQEVFTYIGMLRYYCSQPDGLPNWIYEELESIQKVAYEYGDEHTAEQLVEAIVEDMAPHRGLPPARLLDGSELLFDYDGELIKDLLHNHFTPENTRLDLMSSTFGRASDFDDGDNTVPPGQDLDFKNITENDEFCIKSPNKYDSLHMEPHFGTRFWCHSIKKEAIEIWEKAALPNLPCSSSLLKLPPVNPFIPKVFDLKPLPADDSHHPLLNCSMKLCISVGKRKSWFPATVIKYNGLKNEILLSYEDEEEKWHRVDLLPSDWTGTTVAPDFEGTLDNKAIKYKVVALALDGEGAVLKYGDESDFDVEDGIQFPAIPPAQSESRLPQLVYNTQGLKLWHLQDRKFHRPIAELRMRMTCADANKTALHSACADLFVTLFGDAITETTYLASVCELGSSISANDVGFSMRVHGFDDKLMDLAEFSLNLFFKFRGKRKSLPEEVKKGRFEACLEVLQRRYHNHGLQASKLSSSIRLRCLRPSQWSSYAKAKALEDIEIPTFLQTICNILETMSMEAFFHGNLTDSDAHAATKLISGLISESGGGGLPKKKRPKFPVLKVPPSTSHHLITVPSKDLSDPNTGIEVYFQIGPDNLRDRVMTDLLSHILYEPLYDQLRTRDQFGYTVSTDSRWTYGVMGVHFRVVTATKSAEETVARIDQFIVDYRKELENMTKNQYMENLVGLAKHKLLMASSLSDECETFWSEITDYRYDWQVKRNEVLALRTITKEEVLAKYDAWLMPTCNKGKPRKRRAIGIQVIGAHGGAASLGRPDVGSGDTNEYIEEQVIEFHKHAKNATWGKIL